MDAELKDFAHEIEVTPEMIKAGSEVIDDFCDSRADSQAYISQSTAKEIAIKVFFSMLQACQSRR
jgi:hypothetical protein